MSTKTTFKRVALVTVAALGFGVLTSVAPASAALAGAATSTAATLTNLTTTHAGRIGVQVEVPITATTLAVGSVAAQYATLRFAASITSQPATSAVYAKLIGSATAPSAGFGLFDAAVNLSTGSAIAVATTLANRTSTADATGPASIQYQVSADTEGAAAMTGATVATLAFTPTVAGTYSVTVWNERSASGIAALGGAETSKTFTINVSAGISTVTLAAQNATAAKSGANGSLIKVTLKDVSGNASTLAPGEVVTITPSGSGTVAGVNGSATSGATAGGVWSLAASDFNSSGIAWINVTDTVAETSTITASVNGGASTSTSVSFKLVTASAVAPAPYSATAVGYALSTGSLYNMPLNGATITFRVTVGSAEYANYTVRENAAGSITGDTGRTATYDAVALGSATTGVAAYSVTATQTADSTNTYSVFSVTGSYGAAGTVETRVQGKTNTSGVLAVSPTSVNAVAGSTNTLTATLKDLFGRAYASQTVTISVAGKNPTTVSPTAVTDANGKVTYSLTDANTNSAVTDTVSFTAGSSASTTISYGTNAVSTVTVASDDYTVTGVANDSVTPKAIATAYTGAQAGARTVTATVKNAAGALLAGVPVVFTVSGTTAAVTSTTTTVYTNLSGTASASVYGWATGTYTVTATAGGIAGTATQTFYSTGDDSVRAVSAKASGNQVTGMAKDRFGNAVQGATLYAKITAGTGNIGGALTATGTTDSTGSVVWVVSDATSTVTVSNIPFSAVAGTIVGQTSAAVGYDIGGADATAMTAATTGTTTTAETGVGSTFAAAGVSSASVEATVANDASTAADAAAEATDAANAATDAANAAAEAADAATAAAQDAADAVAALSAQVATLVASIKAQITALTALIVKIQKKVKA